MNGGGGSGGGVSVGMPESDNHDGGPGGVADFAFLRVPGLGFCVGRGPFVGVGGATGRRQAVFLRE